MPSLVDVEAVVESLAKDESGRRPMVVPASTVVITAVERKSRLLAAHAAVRCLTLTLEEGANRLS